MKELKSRRQKIYDEQDAAVLGQGELVKQKE
jgi:hypothetical protein